MTTTTKAHQFVFDTADFSFSEWKLKGWIQLGWLELLEASKLWTISGYWISIMAIFRPPSKVQAFFKSKFDLSTKPLCITHNLIIISSLSSWKGNSIRKSISCIGRGSLGKGSNICYSIFCNNHHHHHHELLAKVFIFKISFLCLPILLCYCEVFSHANRD